MLNNYYYNYGFFSAECQIKNNNFYYLAKLMKTQNKKTSDNFKQFFITASAKKPLKKGYFHFF